MTWVSGCSPPLAAEYATSVGLPSTPSIEP
jgi:hypothetical protein